MVAVPAHGLEDLAQALVVADVVTDQIGLPHFNHFSGNRLLSVTNVTIRLYSRSTLGTCPSPKTAAYPMENCMMISQLPEQACAKVAAAPQ